MFIVEKFCRLFIQEFSPPQSCFMLDSIYRVTQNMSILHRPKKSCNLRKARQFFTYTCTFWNWIYFIFVHLRKFQKFNLLEKLDSLTNCKFHVGSCWFTVEVGTLLPKAQTLFPRLPFSSFDFCSSYKLSVSIKFNLSLLSRL